MEVRAGDRVRARCERWRVESTAPAGEGQLVTLRGLGPLNVDEHRALMTPFDVLEPLATASTPRRIVGRRRWRRLCRAVLAERGGWLSLRTADTAAIDILAHQLAPARSVLRGDGCRVLLADDVGLGKTVQTGLLIAELRARGAVDHVLLLTPAGLRDQWARELTERFALPATVLDLAHTQRLSTELPPGINPWCTATIAIASVDFVKRPEVCPLVRARGWDLVVVDEAHLVSPASDRYAAVEALCALASFVVLVTATPHSGDRSAYQALCALGEHDDPLLVFRRTRTDVRIGGSRRVHRLRVRPSPADARMVSALERYASAVRRERGTHDGAAQLLLTVLRKRALSSPASLSVSVARRLAILSNVPDEAPEGGAQLLLPWQDDAGEFDATDDAPLPAMPALSDAAREQRLLRRILEAGEAALHRETKMQALTRLLRRLERLGESVIVFTEYRDTLQHLYDVLARDARLIHGGMSRVERREAVDAFTSGRCRLLLATDAGGEGLNLHHHCRCVVHLELPWNPMRLEQRTGRVDRIGQRRRVHSFYLVLSPSLEDALLDRLKAKVQQARGDANASDPFAQSDDRALPVEPWSDLSSCLREADRIGFSRRLRERAVATDRLDVASCVSGRGRRRVRLGGVLLVLGVVAEDASGRSVAAEACGLCLTPSGEAVAGLRAPRDLTGTYASPLVQQAVQDALGRFKADGGLDGYETFWAAARRRADSAALHLAREAVEMYQPGLFDRRADHRHQLLSTEHDGLARIIGRRQERCAVAGQPPRAAVRTWLMLSPHPPGRS